MCLLFGVSDILVRRHFSLRCGMGSLPLENDLFVST